MMIVLDTNVFISAILKDSTTRKLIVESEQVLLLPEGVFQELREHREEILEKSGLSKEDYGRLISKMLNYVYIVPNELVVFQRDEAYQIVKDIDMSEIANAHAQGVLTQSKQAISEHAQKLRYTLRTLVRSF